jgi:hypothetical protein
LKKSLIPTLLCTVILIGLAVFVWPTRYRYDHMKMRENDLPVRTDRLSGKTEWLVPQGWRTLGNTDENQKPPTELPTEQVARLTGQAAITDIGWIEVHVYNGSNWTASEITVLVTVLDAQKNQVLSRPYRLIPQDGDSFPQSVNTFHNSLGFTLDKGQTWTWSITRARGKPE